MKTIEIMQEGDPRIPKEAIARWWRRIGWTHEHDQPSTGTGWQTRPDRKGALVLASSESAAALRALVAGASAAETRSGKAQRQGAAARRKAIRTGHSTEDGHHVWRIASDDRIVYLGWIEERCPPHGGIIRSGLLRSISASHRLPAHGEAMPPVGTRARPAPSRQPRTSANRRS